MDSVTPDEPRRAPIRWHVATVRDARTESPTARTLVLDGVFDLAALEDLDDVIDPAETRGLIAATLAAAAEAPLGDRRRFVDTW